MEDEKSELTMEKFIEIAYKLMDKKPSIIRIRIEGINTNTLIERSNESEKI